MNATNTRRALVIEALKVNPNAAAVAREVGNITRRAVGYIAKSANIDLGRSGPKKVSAEQQALIIAALEINPNASAVARHFGGMHYKTVTRLAEKANIKLGPKAQKRHVEPKAGVDDAVEVSKPRDER